MKVLRCKGHLLKCTGHFVLPQIYQRNYYDITRDLSVF